MTKKKKHHIILDLLFIAAACLLAWSGWHLYQIWQTANQITEEAKTFDGYTESGNEGFTVDWDRMKEEYPAICAWLIVPGTGISTPVVQGEDNSFYLTHTAAGADNYLGAIFLDYENSPEFTDFNSIIYGHSTDDGTMFTPLDKFKDESFFNEHDTIWLLTPEHDYRCDVLAFSEVTSASDVYTIAADESQRGRIIDSILAGALWSRDLYDDRQHLLTLSTCDLDYGFHSNMRNAITCYMNETTEPVPAP